MKRLLLDTHVLIWFAEGLPQLSEHSRGLIQRASADDGISISSISFWEVALLAHRRRLALSRPAADWRRVILQAPGFLEAPLTGEIALEAVSLPPKFPADPADRFLAATARVVGLCFATRDAKILRWAKTKHLDVLPV